MSILIITIMIPIHISNFQSAKIIVHNVHQWELAKYRASEFFSL